ncbi:MAG TPA: hypothetical protein VES65_07980 [Solirubrobacteraceae bacterium]|nr:hypothetical protein [Solirubrobacteraceae bacterium]
MGPSLQRLRLRRRPDAGRPQIGRREPDPHVRGVAHATAAQELEDRL